MGYDAIVYIDKKYTNKCIEELLSFLNYKKYRNVFCIIRDDEYKYHSGVNVWKDYENDKERVYRVHAQASASGYDLEKINDTLRTLKKYCNARFVSDNGKNRYFDIETLVKGAESGCYCALDDLFNDFSLLMYSLKRIPDDNESEKYIKDYGLTTPNAFNANVYLIYLCTLMEEFFRSTYIALLKYANNKENVIKKFKPAEEDLIDISDGRKTIEEVYARSLSFQNIHKISASFFKLDKKYDLGVPLKKPYKRRKESLFEQIDRLFEQRHALIHRNSINIEYSTKDLEKDIEDIKMAFVKVYDYICDRNDWEPEHIV